MVKITFLGTGNAFVPPVKLPNGGIDCAWQSNLLLETDSGKKILLDCGTDIRFSLAEQGLTAADIDAVYISHVHADHVGGMEWLAFNTFFNHDIEKPTLYCVDEILWNVVSTLEPGISQHIDNNFVQLDAYFETPFLEVYQPTEVDDSLHIVPVPAIHVPGTNPKMSYGLYISNQKTGRSVFWTSDSVLSPDEHYTYYSGATVVLQDCEIGHKTGLHAHLDDLLSLPAEIRQKMIPYHHDPALIPETDEVQGAFLSFAEKGQAIVL